MLTKDQKLEWIAKAEAEMRLRGHALASPDSVTGSNLCRYRTAAGGRCAIGANIPDELYDPEIETATAGDGAQRVARGPDDKLLAVLQRLGVTREDRPFLVKLQDAHDTTTAGGREEVAGNACQHLAHVRARVEAGAL